MAKLVDALDLGSSGAIHKSSSLFTRTTLRVCDASYGAATNIKKAFLCKKDLIFDYICPKIGRRIR